MITVSAFCVLVLFGFFCAQVSRCGIIGGWTPGVRAFMNVNVRVILMMEIVFLISYVEDGGDEVDSYHEAPPV